MSRSYKRNPVYTDRTHGAKYWKRVSNKKVRKSNNVFLKGNKYKKIYNSWNIHDYISRWSKEQALDYYYNSIIFRNGKWIYIYDKYKSEKEFLDKYWKKYQFRK